MNIKESIRKFRYGTFSHFYFLQKTNQSFILQKLRKSNFYFSWTNFNLHKLKKITGFCPLKSEAEGDLFSKTQFLTQRERIWTFLSQEFNQKKFHFEKSKNLVLFSKNKIIYFFMENYEKCTASSLKKIVLISIREIKLAKSQTKLASFTKNRSRTSFNLCII